MSKEDFERGKMKGAALGSRIVNGIPWRLVLTLGFGLLGYFAGVSSVECVCP